MGPSNRWKNIKTQNHKLEDELGRKIATAVTKPQLYILYVYTYIIYILFSLCYIHINGKMNKIYNPRVKYKRV